MKKLDETTALDGVGSTVGLERAFYEWLTEPQPHGVTTHEWNSTRLKIAFLAGAKAEREACFGALEIVMLMAKNGNYSGQEEAVQECMFAIQERSNAIVSSGSQNDNGSAA